jgi:hypothetical protein
MEHQARVERVPVPHVLGAVAALQPTVLLLVRVVFLTMVTIPLPKTAQLV